MSLPSLTGKVCLVTGGAGGLGKAIAQALLSAGALVAITDINQTLLDSVSASFPPSFFLAVHANVTIEESARQLVSEVVSKFGHLDILVNNAGIMDNFDGVAECQMDMWGRVLAVNLTGPFIMTGLAVKNFLENGTKGRILNIGSLASFRGGTAGKCFSFFLSFLFFFHHVLSPMHNSFFFFPSVSLRSYRGKFLSRSYLGVAYTASKHGLLGLTKNTAATYGKKGIRCNILMPGGMATNISASMGANINMDGLERVKSLMGAVGTEMCDVDAVAKTAVFMCSDLSQVLNGAEIVSDNGWCSY